MNAATLPDIFDDPAAGWPQWLDARRVDDAACAAAYEGTSAPLRAFLKTGLALLASHFGRPAAQQHGIAGLQHRPVLRKDFGEYQHLH